MVLKNVEGQTIYCPCERVSIQSYRVEHRKNKADVKFVTLSENGMVWIQCQACETYRSIGIKELDSRSVGIIICKYDSNLAINDGRFTKINNDCVHPNIDGMGDCKFCNSCGRYGRQSIPKKSIDVLNIYRYIYRCYIA